MATGVVRNREHGDEMEEKGQEWEQNQNGAGRQFFEWQRSPFLS